MKNYLNENELKNIDAYFRACNYLSVGQLYLLDNPLLKRKLELKDIKPNVVGHWGTAPGQNFIYVHLNRIIKKYDLDMIYISGPGHGGQARVSNVYLEGTYSKFYPSITEDEEGLKKLFKQFSFPGGISSHVAPETPGSINEGGELGYSLSHAFGAALDNPNLIVACVVGDGEAETGPLSASWNIIKLMNPKKDGIVLPIVHLNGYKIANPTIMGRMSDEELNNYFDALGYKPYFVSGDKPLVMHELMAKALEDIIEDITKIKDGEEIKNPLIILKTPKGWTGPKEVEGSFKAHQVPIVINKEHEENIEKLENWLKSYRPEELFDENGSLKDELKELRPREEKRMGNSPYANGGILLKELKCPDFTKCKVEIEKRGFPLTSDMTVLGSYVRDLIKLNPNNFKVFGPDEFLSNKLGSAFEVTNRKWNTIKNDKDEFLSEDGAVIDSILSEHVCEGMLEGYLLTGRHGFFHSYEAFIRTVDSMASQHAKWLKVCSELSWRKPIASLNYVLTSHIWQQDHNGFTHQDPGFLNHLVTKKPSITRIYLPPDANCLLSCFDHIVKSKNYINVIVASKHLRNEWLTMEEAKLHCEKGIGIWKFASDEGEPDLVFASAGDTPTIEVMGAITIMKKFLPEIKIRYVNVVDLMKLVSNTEHPHGLTEEEYNNLFTINKPIIFAFHGYPHLIHQLAYKRINKNLHVHGYKEEGTITTPFDMRVQNELDRYHLTLSAIKYLPELGLKKENLKKYCEDKIEEHKLYIRENGKDMDDIVNWTWN